MTQGSHSFKARARDCDGNSAQDEYILVIDNTPKLETDPVGELDGFTDITGNVEFKSYDGGEQGDVNDGAIMLYFKSTNNASKNYEGNAKWTFKDLFGYKFDAGKWRNGKHILYVYATAKNGTKVTKTIDLLIDNTPKLETDPVGELDGFTDITGNVEFKSYDGGEQGDVNDGTIMLYFKSTNNASKNYEGNAKWTFKDLFGYKFDAGKWRNGKHILYVYATAKNGAEVIKSLDLFIDNTPELSINEVRPKGVFDITGSVDFKSYDSGAEGAIDDGTLSLYLDGRRFRKKAYEDSATWSYSEIAGHKLDADTMSLGKHTIKAVAIAHNGAKTTEVKDFYIGDCEISLESIPSDSIPPGGNLLVIAKTKPDGMELTWDVSSSGSVTYHSDDVITSAKGLSIYNIQGEGSITVSASSSGEGPACQESIIVTVGCAFCGSSENCDIVDNNSVDTRIGIGRTNNGSSSGSFFLYAKTPSADLSKPGMLKLSAPGNDTVKLYENDAIKQILAPQFFIDILPESQYRYTIRFYSPESAGNLADGLYEIIPQALPIYEWIIENPDESETVFNRLQLTRVEDGQEKVYLYTYDSAIHLWTLEKGNGLQTITVQNTIDGNTREKERTILNGFNDVATHKKTVFKTIGIGDDVREVIIEERNDPSGANLLTQTAWYEAPCEIGSCGRVQSKKFSDGSWVRYEYDSQGRKITEIKSWLDAGITANPESVHTFYYDYTTHTGDSQNELDLYFPRTVTETIAGVTVGKTYYVYSYDDQENRTTLTEQCHSSNASFGDPSNMRTHETVNALGTFKTESGKLKSRTTPDGLMDSYSYEFGTYTSGNDQPGVFAAGSGNYIRQILTHGTAGSPAGIANKTTRDISIFDPAGHMLFRETRIYTGSVYESVKWSVHTFDAEGHLIKTVNSDGTENQATWDCCGKASDTDTQGIGRTYTHDDIGRLSTEVKHGMSATISTTYTYDGAGRRLSATTTSSGLSLSDSRGYDGAGRISQTIDTSGLVTHYAYSSDGRTTTITRPGGGTEITKIYRDGRVKSITGSAIIDKYYEYGVNPDGSQWTKVFTGSLGSPMWETTTTDPMDRVIRVEKPGNAGLEIQTHHYNNKGQLVRTETTGMADTLFKYNSLGEQIQVGLDLNGNGVLDNASMDRITTMESRYVAEAGNWWHEQRQEMFGKDNTDDATTLSIIKRKLTGLGGSLGLISEVRTTDRFGNITNSATHLERSTGTKVEMVDYPDSDIDASSVYVKGLLTSSQDKTGKTVTYGYDALERRISTTDPRTGTVKTGYNTRNQVTYVEDSAGNRSSFAYDPSSGRKISMTDALGRTVRYAYNLRGELTHTWGAEFPVRYEFNDQGRMVRMHTFKTKDGWDSPIWPVQNSGMADVTTWNYDPSTGLLQSKTDAQGNSTSYSYINGGRLATRTWARIGGTSIETAYSYDASTGELTKIDYSDGTPDITFTYTRAGKQKRITDALGTRTFDYSEQLLPETETLSGLMDRALTRTYDALGRALGISMGSDYYLAYGHSNNGRLTTLFWDIAGQQDSANYTYLPNSHLIQSVNLGSGGTTSYTYEPNRDLKTGVENHHGNELISQYDYLYDDIGRRTSMTTSGFAFELPSVSTLLPGNTTYTSNELNQYTQIDRNSQDEDLAYDEDGNLLEDGSYQYVWNGENRLIQVEPKHPVAGDKRVVYLYDYMGRRIKKSVYAYDPGQSPEWQLEKSILFVYDGWNPIEEITVEGDGGAGATQSSRYFVWGHDLSGSMQGAGGVGGLLAMVDQGNTYHYFYDANGNVGQMVDTADGSVVAHYEYAPFGKVMAAYGDLKDENPFRFSTKFQDDETELVYYGYRHYSPELGRWINRDPLDEIGNNLLKASTQKQENNYGLYLFIQNNPVNNIDILGLVVHYCYGKYRNYDHATVCLNSKCAGLMPLEKTWFLGEGVILSEKFNSEFCIEMDVDEDKCCDQKKYEKCIQREAISKIGTNHNYGLIKDNCISWARNIIMFCQKEACSR